MALEVAFTLPAPRPVEGGLLRTARPTGVAGWTRGLMFNSSECIDGLPFPFCDPPGSYLKVSERPSEPAVFQPVGIVVTVDCSTLGGDPQKYAEQGLDVKREFVLAEELATGAITGNVSLADATVEDTGIGVVEALALLEDEIAAAVGGRQVYIHVSPGNGTRLLAESAIYLVEGQWRTVSGHLVIVSPGYTSLTALHATGDVFADTAEVGLLDSVDREVNTRYVTAEELGIALFDPCFNISVEVGS